MDFPAPHTKGQFLTNESKTNYWIMRVQINCFIGTAGANSLRNLLWLWTITNYKIMPTWHPHALQSVENLFSMKPVPGAKMAQHHCHRASWFSMYKICRKTFYGLTKRIISNMQPWSHRRDFLKDRRMFSLERFQESLVEHLSGILQNSIV